MRHSTHSVRVGDVLIGSEHPVAVQSMTNTATEDIQATVRQVAELYRAGSELVRITVNTEEAARAVPRIREGLDVLNLNVPLVGDFHFNGHRLLTEYPACAEALDKYRINPGNVGRGSKRDAQFATMIETACRYDKAVRIGVNWGSLDQELVVRLMDANTASANPQDTREIIYQSMVTSALDSAQRAEQLGLAADRIILSVKMSGVQDLIAVYRMLAERCRYALHLGLTEAGMGAKGIVASTAALAVLLQQGIGDTIRISLTPEPGGSRSEEVLVAQEILQCMGLRAFTPSVVACPGCGRTSSDYFQKLAQDIQAYLRAQMPDWQRRYPGVENMSVAVMGCVVNGPGEAREADIGLTGGTPNNLVYVDGSPDQKVDNDNLVDRLEQMIREKVAAKLALDANTIARG